jgi:glycosyltransferase involved in cell wall biosynthesis
MSEIVISILIPTIIERRYYLETLLISLYKQCGKLSSFDCIEDTRMGAAGSIGVHTFALVEIIVAMDDREIPTGTKRNILLEHAKGKYVIGLDDDDKPAPFYVEEILKGAETDCDCMAIEGYMTTNSVQPQKWYISKDYPYCTRQDESGNDEFYRFPNHITPIRASIAKQFKFEDLYRFEDYKWALSIHESGLIKTEYKIERAPMYHYDFSVTKK